MTDKERVAAALATLIEHFDAVQIFASRDEGGHETAFVELGAGDWFARYGQTRNFVNDAERGVVLIEQKPSEKPSKEWEQ